MESQIPKSWSLAPVGDLGEWFGGGTPSKNNPAFWNGQIPWVSPKDMKVVKIRDTLDHITNLAIEKSATKLIPENSVVVVTRSGILAHTFPVAKTEVRATLNQDLKALHPSDGIDPDYVAWAFRAFQREILTTCSKGGTTVHSIEMPHFMAFRVPIAPTNEQHRIVTKIEELFSELDKGIENLKTARQQLTVYRQAVLKHAFEGKLTAQWREDNKDKIETADQLLARIQQERDARYEQQLQEWTAAVKEWEAEGKPGKKPTKPRKIRKTTPLDPSDEQALPQIPTGWRWAKLGNIIESDVGFAFKSAEFSEQGIPLLRGDNIEPRCLRWKNVEYWPEEKLPGFEKLIIEEDEVIIAMDRPVISSGLKVAISRKEDVPCLLVQRVCRLRKDPNNVSSSFLYYSILQNRFIAHCLGNQTGTQLPHISETQIKDYPIAICAEREQHELLTRLEEQLSLIDQLEQEIAEQVKKAEALRQSILRKAFSGQLVEQDPNDEPASVLLERIRAEQSANQINSKKKKDAA